MRNKLTLGGLLFTVFLVSVIAHIPAQVIFLFDQKLPKALVVSDVSGSIWNGKSTNILWQQGNRTVDLGAVNWKIDWPALFLGKLALDTRFGQNSSMDLSGKGKLTLSVGQIEIDSLTIRFPIDKVVQQLTLPVPYSASGYGMVTAQNFIWQKEQGLCTSGSGVIQLNNAELNVLSQEYDLGLVKVNLSCEGSDIAFRGNQSSVMLQSGAQGHIAQRQFGAEGSITPKQNVPSALINIMQNWPKDGNGYRFNINRSW
ncbi:type II secretion system protein N [Vibrio sp.]|nr:type II secretion system protein N [Vibrio sp.]